MASSLTSTTDLLIIGAGPAGLMAAAWASKYNISMRLIDDKPERVQKGHADNITCRTLEILDSFGIVNELLQESSPDIQMRKWAPTPSGAGIERTGTVNVQKSGVSDFQQSLINQGRIEQLFEDLIRGEGRARVERGVKTLNLRVNEELALSKDPDVHPVEVDIRRGFHSDTSAMNGDIDAYTQTETICAKYVVGCDGAHSWTRRQVGLEMRGDTTNAVWGVLDIVPLTDFPDIRQTCVINSKDHGALHIVPREGVLVRLYVELAEVDASQGERFDRSSISPRKLLGMAQKILSPYKIDYKMCDWWSVYQVGQRLADEFSVHDRVFLAGDAIHTHSAKVGQGMNVSMGDTYNLTWKICSVIQGLAHRSILSTYQTERRAVALALLDADRATTAYYQSKEKDPSGTVDLQTFRDKLYDFLSGVAVEYADNLITCHHSNNHSPTHITSSTRQHNTNNNTTNILIGRRFPFQSLTILNLASARPTRLDSLLRSTGSWHILLFAGDVSVPNQLAKIKQLTSGFSSLIDSSSHDNGSRRSSSLSAMITIFTIVSCKRDEILLLDLPNILHPWDDTLGWDYGKVFADEASAGERFGFESGSRGVGGGAGNVYAKLGIDRKEGCLVVCRPDQVVGFVGEVDDGGGRGLRDYFGRISLGV